MKLSFEQIIAVFEQLTAPNKQLSSNSFRTIEAEIVDINHKAQSVTLKQPVLKKFLSPGGYIQGGILSAAIDNAIGVASIALLQGMYTTKQFNITFLKPLTTDEHWYFVRVSLIAETDHHATVRCELETESGTVIAIANSTIFELT